MTRLYKSRFHTTSSSAQEKITYARVWENFFVNLLYFNVNSALSVQHVFLVHAKVYDRALLEPLSGELKQNSSL